MGVRLDLIGMVVKDMKAALDFYRRLDLQIPAGLEHEGHVEAVTEAGLRVAWDDVAVIKSFDPHWTEPSGGQRIGLAFLCAGPAEVDERYAALTALGYRGHLAPFDAVW